MGQLTVFSSLSTTLPSVKSNGWPKAIVFVDVNRSGITVVENTAFGVLESRREYDLHMLNDCLFSHLKVGDVYLRDAASVADIDKLAHYGFRVVYDRAPGDDNSKVLRELRNIEQKSIYPVDVYAFLNLPDGQTGLKNGDALRLNTAIRNGCTYLRISSKTYPNFYIVGKWESVLSDDQRMIIKNIKPIVKSASHGRRKNGSIYQTIIFEVDEKVEGFWDKLSMA